MKRTCICIMLAAAALLLLASCGRNAPPTAAPETTAPAPEPSITEEPAMTEPVLTSEPVPAFGCDALFFGDSITADSNFETFFPDLRIVNLGVYGDTLEDLLARVPSVRALRPARIFLLGGINCLREDSFENDGHVDASLGFTVYGYCENPRIQITDGDAELYDITFPVTIQTGEYLEYSSMEGDIHIIHVDTNGVETNLIGDLSLNNDNFIRLPPGSYKVKFSSDTGTTNRTLYKLYKFYKAV